MPCICANEMREGVGCQLDLVVWQTLFMSFANYIGSIYSRTLPVILEFRGILC